MNKKNVFGERSWDLFFLVASIDNQRPADIWTEIYRYMLSCKLSNSLNIFFFLLYISSGLRATGKFGLWTVQFD